MEDVHVPPRLARGRRTYIGDRTGSSRRGLDPALSVLGEKDQIHPITHRCHLSMSRPAQSLVLGMAAVLAASSTACGGSGSTAAARTAAEHLVLVSATAKPHPNKYSFRAACARKTTRLDWLCTLTVRDQVAGVEQQVGLELRCAHALTVADCKIRKSGAQ